MNAWQYMMELHKDCKFQSSGKKGVATNSELKRWLQNKAIRINGETVNFDCEITFPIVGLVLFPKNDKKRISIF